MPTLAARKAFTLIELLVVMIIVGVLASIAIAKFSAVRSKAHFAGMQSDLRNLAQAQEAYFYDRASYSTSLDSIHYNPTRDDSVAVVEASMSGWSATATNLKSSPHFCAMFVGSATPITPATASGVVACQ